MHEERLRKGLWLWLEEEEELLVAAVAVLGERKWDALAIASGLGRSGKSCRLRWMIYLRPNLKHSRITAEEECVIIELHKKWDCKVYTSNQNPSTSKCDTATPSSRNCDYISFEDNIFGSSVDSSDGLKLWSISLAYSPYETKLNEWISNLSHEESKMQADRDFWNFDICSPEWIFKDGNFSIWDSDGN